MLLEAAKRVFCLNIQSSVERKDGKQDNQREAFAWRMTKAERGLALLSGNTAPCDLSYLVLLEASQQHGDKDNKV